MSSQIQITGETKVKSLTGVLVGTSGVVSSLNIDGSLGIPQLDVNGKIIVSQLPNSVMEYLGTWNASTNTPTLVNGTGNAGDVYLCSVAGTVNFGAGAISFVVSDQVIYSGSIWQKASGSNGTVTSVAVTESGDSLNITGSPITTSGTINIGFNGTNLQYVNGAGNLTTFPTLISSIGLSMPSAFSVANSPLTANGTIAVTGAGYPSQYIRGDGTLADFPTSGGGGSSVSYYLNGGTSQGVIGGVTYYEMSKTADTGTGVDFNKTGDGFIVAFLTDAGDPAQLNIPAGNWNYEIYASMSSNGGTPQMYAELYVYDGTTFTLISTSSNEILYDGVNLNLYTFAMTVPATTLALTDRLAIKLYSTNSGGKTTTVHTQDSHLCQVITTFSTGITALNGLTAQVQYFATGTSGTDFNISSTTATHTFNLPVASAANTGKLSSTDWSTFNGKVPYTGATTNVNLGTNNIFSSFVYAEGAGGSSNGGLLIKQYSGAIAANSGYTSLFATPNQLGINFSGVYNAFLQSGTLTSSQTYTFPNASGTLALLESTQTFSGVNTFSLDILVNGVRVGKGLASMFGNTALGVSSLNANTTGNSNTALGYFTLSQNTTGFSNVAIGYNSMVSSNGNENTAIGNQAMQLNTNGVANTGIGHTALQNNTTGNNNIGIGYESGINITTGSNNTIIGKYAGTAALANNIVLADGAGNIRYQWNGTNNVFGNPISGTSATFSSTNTATAFIPSGSTVPTNGMYLSAANTLNFATNTTNRLTIDASGNLGLGVTPSAWSTGKAIDIGSSGAVFGDGINTAYTAGISQNAYLEANVWKYKISSQPTGRYEINGASHTWFSATSGTAGNAITFTQAMTLFSDGNLLLTNGTVSNAGYKLDVNGTGRFTSNLLAQKVQVGTAATINDATGVGNTLQFANYSAGVFVTGSADSYIYKTSGAFGGLSAQTLIFQTRSDVAGGGFAFVAGSTPSAVLSIASTGAATFSSSVTAGTGGYLISGDNHLKLNCTVSQNQQIQYQNNGTNKWQLYLNTSDNSFNFYNSTNSTSRLTILESGNVGIGTSSPSHLLTVSNTSFSGGAYGLITLIGGDESSIMFMTTSYGADTNKLLLDNATGSMQFRVNSAERMRITSGGNVLIGTTTDAGHKLQVNGTTQSSNYRTINNSATIPASSTATILTLSNTTTGVYIINANFGGQGNQAYGGALIVVANAGSFRIVTNGSGASSTLTLSSNNVQIYNGLGVPLDATANAILITNT